MLRVIFERVIFSTPMGEEIDPFFRNSLSELPMKPTFQDKSAFAAERYVIASNVQALKSVVRFEVPQPSSAPKRIVKIRYFLFRAYLDSLGHQCIVGCLVTVGDF